ncbi:MAG: hypothetical protein A2X08_17435 [Bacteroidetes bacterium GWA2_32_17]|nr:MAG: hypothetical protein A2X08_17435 [Bacteroidetes bacterium GWA2_32_17]
MRTYFIKTSLILIILFHYFCGKTQEISDSLFNVIINNSDIIILNEKTTVNYTGRKADFMFVNISKEITYQINSENGINKIKRISIPEMFDPTFIQHSSTAQKTLRLFDKIIIDSIYTSVNSTIKPEIINNYTLLKKNNLCIKDDFKYGNIVGYYIDIKDITVGSVVKIKYSLNFPFDENWKQLLSTRIFFNSKFPKIKYELNWLFPKKLEVDTFFYKFKPEIDTLNNFIALKWKLNNLAGCIEEPGSYPYIDLPWFTFSPKPNVFLNYYYNTNEVDYAPLWYFLSYRRVKFFLNAKLDAELGLKTSNQLAFNSLAEKFIESKEKDSTGFYSLCNFQNWIVNEIKYNNDNDFYKELVKESMDKSGQDLKNNELKDHNRFDVYAHMISSLGLDYYASYPVDKRYGEISNHYFTTIYDCDMLMVALLKNNTFTFLYPLSDNSRYYFEELPFYFENIKTQVIPASYYGGYKEDIKKQYMSINTPSSKLTDNKRRTNSVVNVKIDENVFEFTTKVDLMGQYSTLTRNVYKHLPSDSSINSLYLEKAYNINKNVKINKEVITQSSIQYPYISVVNLEYSTNNCISKKDSVITINLNSWFKHIYYPTYTNNYRFTSYYSDFMGTDAYVYLIKFDKPIQLILSGAESESHNEFGDYVYKTEQVDEYQIKITSYLSIKAAKVNASNISLVNNIYQSVSNDKLLTLKIK